MIRCWYYRRVISNSVDAAGALPEATREHVERCPSCRAQHESEMEVARRLSAAAREQEPGASPFLHAQIMSALAKSTGPERARPLSWAVPIALGVASVVLAGVLWWREAPTPGVREQPVAGLPSVSAPEKPAAAAWPQGAKLRDLTTRLDEPMATEIKLVVADTRTVMNSLANNFIPEQVRSTLFARPAEPEM